MPAPLRPSVFISYSSDDRAAARALRDALAATGLEVWYDENELGGGDSWDQKLRKQIRDCDYFMPVISASTERRKEGYFRREWRLASERTMDMADDVLFLLPVVIDETSEAGARVPDKFLTVQWLRAPGGQSTPALEALTKRLLAGEHTIAPRPPLVGRSVASSSRPPVTTPPFASAPPPVAAPAAAEQHGPPPMPPFPHHAPNTGHWPRYVAEVLWWCVTAAWVVITKLPKFIRIILAAWFMIWALGMCRSTVSSSRRPSKPDAPAPAAAAPDAKVNEEDIKTAIQTVTEETAAAIKAAHQDGKGPDYTKLGEELARRFNQKKSSGRRPGGPKTLAVVPFERDPQDSGASNFAQSVFASCYGQLIIARPGEALLSNAPPGEHDDVALTRIGKDAGVALALGANTTKAADGSSMLTVHLVRCSDGSVVWSSDFPIAAADAASVGGKIAEAVLAAMPPKKP